MSSLLDKIVPRLVVILLLPLALLPLALGRRVGAGIGRLVFRCVGSLRRRVIAAIDAARPGIVSLNPAAAQLASEEIAARFFVKLGKFFVEVLKIYVGLGRRVLEQVEFRGLEHYEQAKANGKGVLFVTAHSGNWEAMALAFGMRYQAATIVVRRQRSAQVTKMLAQLRDRYGNKTILKEGAARKVIATIRTGGVVAILADIAVNRSEGILSTFLGRPAWTTALPAVVAQKTGCALLPGFARREGDRLIVDFYPSVAIDGLTVEEITATLSQHIEQHIARYPDEWFWFYRRWKGAPEPLAADGQTDI